MLRTVFKSKIDAIERLTRIHAEKKRTAPSVAEARRELGHRGLLGVDRFVATS